MDKEITNKIIASLDNEYEDVKTFLNYSSAYELLIAVILSAQCTDRRVNEITSNLFRIANTPQMILDLGRENLQRLIKSGGLSEVKSKNIIEASKIIIDKFRGIVPDNMEDLLILPGVGRKTANVILSHVYNKDAIAVDTHVFRVSNRIGLADEKTPYATEAALMSAIDRSMWSKMHYKLILHGRNVCTARNPKCDKCAVNNYCLYYKNKKEI
ncbi:MAG: endonuclease III [Eubacteriaceae bacterium]|nr:endonuclease III [Eubacteriaceae bacterium]